MDTRDPIWKTMHIRNAQILQDIHFPTFWSSEADLGTCNILKTMEWQFTKPNAIISCIENISIFRRISALLEQDLIQSLILNYPLYCVRTVQRACNITSPCIRVRRKSSCTHYLHNTSRTIQIRYFFLILSFLLPGHRLQSPFLSYANWSMQCLEAFILWHQQKDKGKTQGQIQDFGKGRSNNYIYKWGKVREGTCFCVI